MFRRRKHYVHHNHDKKEDAAPQEPLQTASKDEGEDQSFPVEESSRSSATLVTEIVDQGEPDTPHTPEVHDVVEPHARHLEAPDSAAPGTTLPEESYLGSEPPPNIPDHSEELKDALSFDEGKKATGSLVVPFFVALTFILAGVAGYFSLANNQLHTELEKQKREIQDSSGKMEQKIVDAVARHTDLPGGGQPLVTTIIDSSRLKDISAFFTGSKDGDKLIIAGKKAIIYRQGDDLIVATGIVAFEVLQSTPSGTRSALAEKEFTFVLRNATTIAGLTKKYEPKLKKVLPKATVTKRENAQKQALEDTMIIDVAGKYDQEVKDIAKALTIEVGTLPDDEPKPAGVDFVILLGTDAE